MNSRWQANKIGLVNFWYYDEQEFPFAKGRMLLRGSNGSGKSVTMQSVVPLLLDGNASPERLDPFGTRDRKMSNYLLEEDDDREERTGYLYLEFRRLESEAYLTIGMGMRARRGKPLDKWYFAITDNRRVGKDFLLYKQTGEKITLSKKELENRIAEGGRTFDRQLEYMDFVNRQVFGFDTLDEYKEMIDLLIQLRTPKLSKDFKPSVINEILSDSLQPLSDEDLRPMSEAIENMDTMNMNLKTREGAKQAAEKISRVFERYNKFTLYQKTDKLWQKINKEKSLKNEEKEKQDQLEQCHKKVAESEETLVRMAAKNVSMQKEQETLNSSDALNLKKREAALEKEITDYQNTVKEKEQFLETKKQRYFEIKERRKEEENRKYEKSREMNLLLEEMQSEAEDMAFEEHGFFQSEFLQQLEKEYKFDTLRKQFYDTKEKIEKAFHILEQTNLLDRQADKMTMSWEQKGREVDACWKRQNEVEALLVQAENEWKEALYQWSAGNRELCLSKEFVNEISRFADSYNGDSDFAGIRQKIGDQYLGQQMSLEKELDGYRCLLEEKEASYEELKKQLQEWENKKEPEPVRSEAVLKNRKRLEELEIPYQEFYKVIEFGTDMSEEAQNRLEEALLQMGILDAVIVDEQYRDQVLAFAEGCEDRYLFAGGARADQSLLDVLELNEELNDIFFNQRITGILSHVAYDEMDVPSVPKTGQDNIVTVSPDGSYRVGVIAGTVSGNYTAQFMGARAREKARLARMEECRQNMEILLQERKKFEKSIHSLELRLQKLKEEYEKLPADTDMRAAWKLLDEAVREYDRAKQEEKRLEEELQNLKEQIRIMKEEAFILAKVLYLDCTFAVFQQAFDAADEYKDHLIKLNAAHEIYLHWVHSIENLEDQMEQLDGDLDQIRYDITTAQREFNKRQEEYLSVQKQLLLTDYEQVKERLDECVKWINEYPMMVQKYAEQKTENREQEKQLQMQLMSCREQLEQCIRQKEWLKRCWEAEWKLGYVSMPEEIGSNIEKMHMYLETDAKDWDRDSIVSRLNQVYFENRAFLNDYQLTQLELFTELDEDRTETDFTAKRQDIQARYKGVKIPFVQLLGHLEEDIEELKNLIRQGDRELFEDILANTVSRKIRSRINASTSWVSKMNDLMGGMNTSSGLKLSLRWRSKVAESEDQLDTRELVNLLKKDYRLMSEEEASKLSRHFRSKVDEARRHARESGGMVSFYQVMKETLDYRKWFEFQLYSQKTGEKQKELTNSVFGTFSGGEKAMSMYVPLFSAVVAKYEGGRPDAPRLISLDEAFAGVDNRNIRDMFRLMTEFSFNFIINSQVLWGDCDTLDALAIYQLERPENAKFVTVMPYLWNGHYKENLEDEESVERRSVELG